MAADKAKLLHSLKIDRGESEPPQTARRRWPALLAAGMLACAAVVAAAIWLPEFRISQSASQQAAPSAPAAAPAVPAAAAAAEPRRAGTAGAAAGRSEEHTSELQSLRHLVCRLLLEKKNLT